jgi:3-oxoacyl-[acyl-carrier protein] reductase
MAPKKVALVTGSAKGLGKFQILALAKAGFNVSINYRSQQKAAAALVCKAKSYGADAIAIKSDVAYPEQAEALVDQTVDHFGRLDVLIHNAGPFIHERKKLTDYALEEWRYLLEGNLSSTFYLCRRAIPLMRQQRWGRIITLGFDQSDHAPGWVYRSAYAAAKTGLTSLTKTLALEEAEHGITVNMIAPGDITGENKEKSIEEVARCSPSDAPVGRPGTGEDIARIILFLIDEKSDFLTGNVIQATGGYNVLEKVFRAGE